MPSPEIMNRLLRGTCSPQELVTVAKDPALALGGQLRLTREPEPVLHALASNPSLQPRVQLILTSAPKRLVRRQLAQNPFLTPEVQLLLARDDERVVRQALAGNGGIASEAALLLSRDPDLSVVVQLSVNRFVEPADAMPVGFLELTTRGRGHLSSRLADLDPAALAALRDTWEGTLDELRLVCTSFAPA